MKKILLIIPLLCLLVGCTENEHDTVEIFNKSYWIFDDYHIEIKDGYFIDKYEKFTVDENTIGVTLYFTNDDEKWGSEE